MKYIKLNKGQTAIIDDEDFEYLSQFKWHADFMKNTQSFRAVRNNWINGKNSHVKMHREIMGNPTGKQIDHINHNSLDNRKVNLRIVTGSQNQMNRKIQKNNTSGYPGISFHKPTNSWNPTIKVNNKVISLKYFKTLSDAIEVRRAAEEKYFGEYKYQGSYSPFK